jgi:hypothetical protein
VAADDSDLTRSTGRGSIGAQEEAGTVRHLFDQYDGTENRVTHALACCLAEDPKLLACFIEWSTGRKPPAHARLHVLEQQLPGDPPLWKEVAERRGLPDICIHDGDAWCFLIENKLGAALTASQLRRHRSTILGRGFESVEVLAICPTESASSAVDGAHQRRWTQVYEWSRGLTRTSRWAGCLADYLEVVEMRLDEEGRERGWSLTTFTGIPFSSEIPYEYRQAKRLLKLAMEALRQRQDLREQLGIAQDGGRGKITGREADGVWDTLRLSRAPAEEQMQSLPHLTLAIGQQCVLAILVLPNGLKTEFRRRLRDLGLGGFLDLLREVTRGMSARLSGAPGWVPWVQVVQRRYPSRSGSGIEDAELTLDLRTAFADGDRQDLRGVKPQPLWAQTAFEAFANRRGTNTLLAVGGKFPYGRCPAMAKREALDYVAAAWISCRPVTDLLFGA